MNVKKKIVSVFGLIVLLSAIVFSACKKEVSANTAGTQQLSVYLTDNPSPYDSVFIDIKFVEVKLDTSEGHKHDDHFGDNDNDRDNDHKGRDEYGKWDTLKIVPGIYNVSKLRNGLDTLLGTANINGVIRKIRITLGARNSLNIAGVTFPINLLSGINNYLYVKVNNEHHHEATMAQTALWIDFDISRSIIFINGQYYLKPVLRPFCDNNFARIKGAVFPADANPLVIVYNGTDTANAIPKHEGEFMIRGLKAGTYNVWFKGSNGYKDTTILNIQLQNGAEKILAPITLRK